MRIGIDARFITKQPRRGIGNYSLNLVNELVRLDPSVDFILYISHPDAEDILPKLPNVTIRRLKMPFYPLWENIALPMATWIDRIDILHCLGNTAPFFRPKKVKLVLTLMDVMFLLSGEFIPKPVTRYQKYGRLYSAVIVPPVARSADGILTSSEFSRQDILRMIPKLDATRVSVSYFSCDKIFSNFNVKTPRDDLREILDFPYILCLGADDPRKNTLRLVDAYLRMINDFGVHSKLVICGYKNWENSEAYQSVKNAGAFDKVIFLSYVDINDLALLYTKAMVFVYPSLYEGFGIPILEALSSGCPVIASNTTGVPEAGGNAVLYVDPLNEIQIAQTLFRVLNDVNLRNSLKELGYARASQFSWARTAQQTLSIYERSMSVSI